MNLHDFLLALQYITVGVMFIELLIVFTRWRNSIHSYLFLTCITTFINNIGYLLEMKAGSEEAYLTALKLSYVGRTWIVFAYFLFAAKMCRIKLRRGIVYAVALLHIVIYSSILTIGSNNLYYTSYEFVPDPLYPKFFHTNGYMHDLLMACNVILIAFAMFWVVKEFRREKNKTSKTRLFMLILAFGVQALSFILHVSKVFPISEYYDLTIPGTFLGTVFMLIGIFGFDLLGTREIARDFVIDRISEGIIAVDNEGRIQYYNEPVVKLYPEFSRFFAMKRDIEEIISEKEEKDNAPAETETYRTPYDIIETIEKAIRDNETLKIKDRVYTPEENDLVHRGVKYGKLYALVDDTEHYRYMEELQEQRDIADSANEAKSRFLANMSHEIRTPINAVIGMDEMILRESSEKTIRSYAADIMSAGKTLLSLINDILDLSKVEEGKMEIIPVRYDLSSLIGDLVNMIRDRAEKKGLKLNVSVDEHIPHLLVGDEIRVRQCAMNILTNAVKYTEKGEVTLKISYEKKDDTHIFLGVSVEDTGIGMKAEDMEKLFRPYERIEEKRNRRIEGTGLGMSITRQLLDLMGSELKVSSEYGKGSVFSFSVEQEVSTWEEIGNFTEKLESRSDTSYEYHELFHAPTARIMVVDDTEMNLTVIKSLLKRTEIQIDTAASGKEALSLADSNSYDAVFIDHMMPDMDGIETLHRLRDKDNFSRIPAVALTANAVSGAREMYLNAGFTDYLSKPIDGEALEKMLARLLPEEKVSHGDGSPDSTVPPFHIPPSAVSQENRPHDSLPEWLYSVEGMDAKEGLKNCGSAEGYISVLTVFYRTAGKKADEIESALGSNDIENYTIKVHALKSSARIIGAANLSKLAEMLENAGKEKNTDLISMETGALLKRYRNLGNKLSRLDPGDEDLPEIDPASMSEAYRTVAEIAQIMDYQMMDSLLKDIKGYRLPPEDKEKIALIEQMLTELNWDKIMEIAGGED